MQSVSSRVFGNNLTLPLSKEQVTNDYEDSLKDDYNPKCSNDSQSQEKVANADSATGKSRSKPYPSYEGIENSSAKHANETENIALPFRKNAAAELFKKNQEIIQSVYSRVLGDEPTLPLPIDLEQDKTRRVSEECKLKPTPESLNIESQAGSHIRYFFYKAAKCFQHFHYIYNLTRDCKSRVDKFQNNNGQTSSMSKSVVVAVLIVGNFTNDNLSLVSKCKGKRTPSKKDQIWEAIPLLCFQNDLALKTALDILSKESACHKILIKSDTDNDEIQKHDASIITVNQNKEHIHEIITRCLEEPLHQMLQQWTERLTCKTESSTRRSSRLIGEIEDIRKQMELGNCKHTTSAPIVTGLATKCIVPEDVKKYLFRRQGVHSFGIWRNATFKVFVSKDTDENYLKEHLMTINQPFFEKYNLDIEKKKYLEKLTMKQGDPILPFPPNEEGKIYAGTLGGFVSKRKNERKIYALTCNHVFPSTNQPAYANDFYNFREIGKCVFTTREKSCDFAAIEIDDSFSNECDVTIRREDKKKTNAKVYTEILEGVIFVHKIGAETGVTTGSILSSEFYNNVIDAENQEYIFLVEGTNGIFSTEGDSGSLVITRPKTATQNFVYVLGMVYASNLIQRDGDYDSDSNYSKSQEKGAISGSATGNLRSNPSTSDEGVEKSSATHAEESKNISLCCRMNTALGLFKDNQGEDFEVSFKDDLSSSSSESANSDDSNEETSE